MDSSYDGFTFQRIHLQMLFCAVVHFKTGAYNIVKKCHVIESRLTAIGWLQCDAILFTSFLQSLSQN